MWSNPQITADLLTFTEEILNGKLHFLFSGSQKRLLMIIWNRTGPNIDWLILQKQPSAGVLGKSCSENMQQIYKRTPMPKCDFNKVALHCNFIEITLRHGCSPVNVLHMFRIPFLKNTSGRLLLNVCRRHESFLWAYGIKKIVFFI